MFLTEKANYEIIANMHTSIYLIGSVVKISNEYTYEYFKDT